jgi:hypothetical protein
MATATSAETQPAAPFAPVRKMFLDLGHTGGALVSQIHALLCLGHRLPKPEALL